MNHEKYKRSRRRIRKDLKKPIRGFFFIKCVACGKVKGFYTRNYLEDHECSCGQHNDVLNSRMAYINCKCGYERRYHTNITERRFEFICPNCGGPVDMEYSPRDGVFQSLVDEE